MKLTELQVRKAAPGEKPRKLTDGAGMYLLVTPSGGKLWRLKYRVDGKEKVLALGRYPDIGLADARARRDEARRQIARGADPSAERVAERQARALVEQTKQETFEVVARRWMDRQEVAEITANKNRWILETFLFPHIGHRPIGDITPRELLNALRQTESSGMLETTKRAKIKAGQVFRFAILEGLTDNDPTPSLRGTLKTPKPKHHAAVVDPKEIGALLRAIDGFAGQLVTKAALQLVAMVFVRPGELRRAEWTEIDLDGSIWRIPGERMKMKAPHLVPLSTQAVSILRELQPLTGSGRYVFPGLRSASRPMSENTVNAALRRLGYSGDEMTGHGFRSLAATRLNEMGWNADAIERQLAHAESNKVREAYTHAAQYLDERKRMMQAWADHLEGLKQ
ncbi:tyrosine-type recombinase/integrase [Dyella sp. GSA-30]|uniref:tyrosine-type recombinase/integrase n=1 Tax=Dyella sp. GSA-30 TaxID=2994496 RepID=UPI002490CDC8|nr:tyrosine-type recombinase/integrase [Dyella sp. GSA-30]BDU22047.1 integrase [Dyella sp. GSA-30]